MKTTEDILASIKKEVKLSKKLGKETPTGRQVTLKNIEAEEKARKLRKDNYNTKFFLKLALVVGGLGLIMPLVGPFLPPMMIFPLLGIGLAIGMVCYKGDEA